MIGSLASSNPECEIKKHSDEERHKYTKYVVKVLNACCYWVLAVDAGSICHHSSALAAAPRTPLMVETEGLATALNRSAAQVEVAFPPGFVVAFWPSALNHNRTI